MKKLKKAVDLWKLYISPFVAEVPPEEFEKILNNEHEFLYIRMINNTGILTLRKNSDTKNPRYEFFKSKSGKIIKCIEEYYELTDNSFEQDIDIKHLNNIYKCYKSKKYLLDNEINPENSIFECKQCHYEAFRKYKEHKLKLKGIKANNGN